MGADGASAPPYPLHTAAGEPPAATARIVPYFSVSDSAR